MTTRKTYFFNATETEKAQAAEFLGFCRGVIADGIVNQAEAKAMKEWLDSNPEFVREWPINVLSKRLSAIYSDGVVSEEELIDLKSLVESITGEGTDTPATLPLDNPLPRVVLKDKTFCFTGEFAFGTRSACENTIKALGGACKSSVSAKLDYLVIGSRASLDWANQTYGRKIEKAVSLREKQPGNPHIIDEKHWAASLNQSDHALSLD